MQDHHPEHGIALVIISHAVAASHLEQFQSYQDELHQRVKAFEGFFGTESFPPYQGVQEEWVVVYRFLELEQLKNWLDSKARREIVNKIDGLLDRESYSQILVAPPESQAVTVVFSHKIKKGCEKDFRAWRLRLLNAQKKFDGFRGAENHDPCTGITTEWVDVTRFINTEKLDIWMRSKERKRLVEELQPILEDLAIRRVNSGLNAWFGGGENGDGVETPPSWKQAMSVWLALYPTVMFLSYYFNPLFGDMSLSLMMLIANAVSVAVLNWLLMPLVSKLLNFWLLPEKQDALYDVLGGAGILASLILMYFLFVAINPL